MVIADFKCECGEVQEIAKPTVMSDWPEVICEKCKKVMKRCFVPIQHEVARGKTGNASTGYQTEVTYHPSMAGRGRRTKVE